MTKQPEAITWFELILCSLPLIPHSFFYLLTYSFPLSVPLSTKAPLLFSLPVWLEDMHVDSTNVPPGVLSWCEGCIRCCSREHWNGVPCRKKRGGGLRFSITCMRIMSMIAKEACVKKKEGSISEKEEYIEVEKRNKIWLVVCIQIFKALGRGRLILRSVLPSRHSQCHQTSWFSHPRRKSIEISIFTALINETCAKSKRSEAGEADLCPRHDIVNQSSFNHWLFYIHSTETKAFVHW